MDSSSSSAGGALLRPVSGVTAPYRTAKAILDAGGEAFVSTDKDGVGDSIGERHFWLIATL
jgi:hypothetical protein